MRIQLVVSDAQQAMIEKLRQQTGASTIKEVFNNALTLLNWAVRQRQEGLAICAINDEKDVHKELQLPALDHCMYAPASPRPEIQETRQAAAAHLVIAEDSMAPAPMHAARIATAAAASAKAASAKAASAGKHD